jgi:hypothetical protein
MDLAGAAKTEGRHCQAVFYKNFISRWASYLYYLCELQDLGVCCKTAGEPRQRGVAQATDLRESWAGVSNHGVSAHPDTFRK